jgi:hypothetical protein
MEIDHFDLRVICWVRSRGTWISSAKNGFPGLSFDVDGSFEICVLTTIGTHEHGEVGGDDWVYTFEMPSV